MLKLNDRKYKSFKISDIFKVSGTVTTHPSKLIEGGFTPRITCAATNNGLDGTYKNAPTEKGDVLTIDSATIGYVSYQYRDFIATDHVEKLMFKDGSKIGYHCGLFIKTMIDNAVSGKYGYGYKFSQTRIKKQTIILPITAEQEPDWQFMEEYMKQVERKILKPTIERLCKRLIISDILGGVNRCVPIGKPFTLPKFLPRFNVVNALKKPTTSKAILPMHHQHPSITVLTDLLEMMAA